MAEKKSIPVCIILTIVTLGIYGIFWFIAVHNSTKVLANEVVYGSDVANAKEWDINGEKVTIGVEKV